MEKTVRYEMETGIMLGPYRVEVPSTLGMLVLWYFAVMQGFSTRIEILALYLGLRTIPSLRDVFSGR